MRAIIYSNDNQESERAESLLKSVQFSGHDISVYHVGQDFSETGFKSEFGEKAEYPQITIDSDGSRHVGSLKDLLHFFKDKGIIL